MNVEITIQYLFDNYPGIFKERADCLNQLFCSIGNGFYWQDGELIWKEISDEEINTLNKKLVDGKAFQYNKLSLRQEAIYYYIRRAQKLGKDIPENPMDMFDKLDKEYFESLPDDQYYDHPERYKRWSFYHTQAVEGKNVEFNERFAYLFNYPNDIKPDWFAALNECREMLIQDGFDLPK